MAGVARELLFAPEAVVYPVQHVVDDLRQPADLVVRVAHRDASRQRLRLHRGGGFRDGVHQAQGPPHQQYASDSQHDKTGWHCDQEYH